MYVTTLLVLFIIKRILQMANLYGKNLRENPRTPSKNGGNDDFPVHLIGLPKNWTKIGFMSKNRLLKIGKFRL